MNRTKKRFNWNLDCKIISCYMSTLERLCRTMISIYQNLNWKKSASTAPCDTFTLWILLVMSCFKSSFHCWSNWQFECICYCGGHPAGIALSPPRPESRGVFITMQFIHPLQSAQLGVKYASAGRWRDLLPTLNY